MANLQRDISEINADLHRLRPGYRVEVEQIIEEGVFEELVQILNLKYVEEKKEANKNIV